MMMRRENNYGAVLLWSERKRLGVFCAEKDEKSFEMAGKAEEAEEDMIELAYEPNDTSRLGCQLCLSSQLEGMTVVIPGGANNMFDHIPFE
eukprot:symbB.v1.2.009916.t1/scaffold633.1/size178333/8